MAVVDGKQLKRFMSEPEWGASQSDTADLVCASVEAGLEAALNATFITPRPWTETARILADGGLVDTTYPVHAVTRIDGGGLIADGDPLPGDYVLQDHRLYYRPAQESVADRALVSGWPFIAPSPPRFGSSPYSGAVRLEYLAGWGAESALVLAILRKAQSIMGNRHDDTVTVRALDASAPPKMPAEDWTDTELKPLGVYRRLGIGQH